MPATQNLFKKMLGKGVGEMHFRSSRVCRLLQLLFTAHTTKAVLGGGPIQTHEPHLTSGLEADLSIKEKNRIQTKLSLKMPTENAAGH